MDSQDITLQDIFDLGVIIGKLPKPQDAYTWRVKCVDGTCTDEYDEAQPDGRGWADREEKPVQAITLIPIEGATGKEQSIPIPEGATPVFFRRRRIAINLTDESSPRFQPTVHCIGWKRGEQAAYLFVFDDGSTLLSDNLQAV